MKKIKFILLIFIIVIFSLSCEKEKILKNPHWSLLSSGVEKDLTDIHFVNEDCGYILSQDSLLLKSVDGGATWRSVNVANVELSGMSFPTEDVGYVIGQNGTIFKTIDGAETWRYCAPNDNYHNILSSVFFTSTDTGYVVGGKLFEDKGAVLKTSDGGKTWSDLSSNILSKYLYSTYFINNDIGYAVGDNGIVIKTIDGGESWDNLYSKENTIFISVLFISKDVGFISGGNRVGDNGIILKTINGGNSWEELSLGTRSIGSLYFQSKDIGYALSFDSNLNGLFLKTNDMGTTWSIDPIDIIDVDFSSVFFSNEDKGYVVGEEGTILYWGK